MADENKTSSSEAPTTGSQSSQKENLATGQVSIDPPTSFEKKTSVRSLTPWYAAPFLWGVVLCVLLASTLGWLMYEKWIAEKKILLEQETSLQALKEKNDSLENYLNTLKGLLKKDPCDIERALASTTPPADVDLPVLPKLRPTQTKNNGANSPTQNPSQSDNKSTSQEHSSENQYAPSLKGPHTLNGSVDTKQPAPQLNSLADILDQSTVLLLALQGDNLTMGTGFFIAKDTILTNAHVIGQASRVVYINKRIGSVKTASVLTRTTEQGLDFAVLKTVSMPITPLKFATNPVTRMTKVSAWGFPGSVTADDPHFKALLNGQGNAAPEVVYTEGAVNVLLDRKPPLIVHSATVSQGNSGGPLVNERGEVVGINTMIKLDNQSYRQSSLAITSSTIIAFLKANNIAFETARTDGGSE